ncbi:MAG: tetratricopeptide repeat protein [Planctomycetes bacterium]|nr:tetratricopeptide repeat protein [Planctomycetota bacterium]
MPATVDVEMKIPLHCRRLLILVLVLFASCRPSRGKEVPAPPPSTKNASRDLATGIGGLRSQIPVSGNDAIHDLKDPVSWVDRGRRRKLEKDYEGAIADCDRALELNPGNAGAWIYRAIVHVKRREFEAALSDCNKAIEVDPKEGEAWYWRGLVKYMTGDSAAAEADFLQALQAGGSQSLEYIRLARWVARLKIGDKIPKGTELGATFNSQPESEEDVWKHALLAFSHGSMTREDLIARAEAAQGPDRSGRICEAHYYAGAAALSEGREAEAIADFEESVATGLIPYTEYDLAQYELERLKKPH